MCGEFVNSAHWLDFVWIWEGQSLRPLAPAFSFSTSLLQGFVMLMQTDVADSQWFFICRWREIKGEWRGVAIVLTVPLSVTNKLLHCTAAIFHVLHLHLQASTPSSLLKSLSLLVRGRSVGVRLKCWTHFHFHKLTDCVSAFICAPCVCARLHAEGTCASARAVKEILPHSIYATECYLFIWVPLKDVALFSL